MIMREMPNIFVSDNSHIGRVDEAEEWLWYRNDQQGILVSFVVIFESRFVTCVNCLMRNWR